MKIFQTAILKQRIIIYLIFIAFFIYFDKSFNFLHNNIFIEKKKTIIFTTNCWVCDGINIFVSVFIRNNNSFCKVKSSVCMWNAHNISVIFVKIRTQGNGNQNIINLTNRKTIRTFVLNQNLFTFGIVCIKLFCKKMKFHKKIPKKINTPKRGIECSSKSV